MGSNSYSETMDHLNWKDEIFDLLLYEFHTIFKGLFSCEILSASVITDWNIHLSWEINLPSVIFDLSWSKS